MLGRRQLHAASKHRAIFHADPLADHIAGERTFAADIHAIAALHVARDLAHDHNFTRGNVGGDYAVASNGDTMIFER